MRGLKVNIAARLERCRPLACALLGLLSVILGASPLNAQAGPPDGRHPMCMRLEGQLNAADRGGVDGRADQFRRFEEAAGKQQQELDRTLGQSRRFGCEGGNFFLFGGGSPQCDQLNGQIQRMRSNLDRMHAGMQQVQGGGISGDEQRRSILVSLAQYDCGPQYRGASVPPRPRGLFDTLFGPQGGNSDMAAAPGDMSSSYRTICVRTCDGYFFPISTATNPGRFREDERSCQRQCPAAEAVLFSHRTTGEDVSRAVSLAGKPYSELPNAFRYRQEYNSACSCKRPGESWAEALAGADDRIERGDIVVTDEKAKALSQPRQEAPARPVRQDANRGRARAPASAEATAQPRQPTVAQSERNAPVEAAGETPAAQERPRNVGPQFYR